MVNRSDNVTMYVQPKTKMTQHEVEALRRAVPDDLVPLPTGHLACEGCGIAVTRKATFTGHTAPVQGQRRKLLSVDFSRCEDCQAIRDRADEMVAAMPGLVARLGPQLAREHIESVLNAHAVVNKPLVYDLAVLIPRLRYLGDAVRYATPPFHETHDKCSPYPWAHVGTGDRSSIRQGLASAMADRLSMHQPPVRLPCPSRGCLLCGVGAVTMGAVEVSRRGGKEAAQASAWRHLFTYRHNLGGRPSPDQVAGHLCPTCSAVLNDVGTMGPSVRERAVVNHVHATLGLDKATRLANHLVGDFPPGLPAWGAFQGTANPQPWSHLVKVFDGL